MFFQLHESGQRMSTYNTSNSMMQSTRRRRGKKRRANDTNSACADVMLFNTVFKLNNSSSKRACVGMSLVHKFHPVLVLENPRYGDTKVILSYEEWTRLCDTSGQINAMFNGIAQPPTVIIGEHTVTPGDFPQTLKIYSSNEDIGECIHLQENTFKNLMYASFKIEHAFNERLGWQPYVQRFYEGVWNKLMDFANMVQDPSETVITQQYDIYSGDMYETEVPEVGMELRSYMGMYIYPSICNNL